MLRAYRAVSTIATVVVSVGLVLGVAAVRQHRHRGARTSHQAYAVAPDFLLMDLNGHPIHLSSFRGKVVLVDYWATWCAPCKIEIPRLVALEKEYGAEGLQVIGISMDDTPEPVRIFADELRMNYPIALGNLKVAEAYGGVLGLPVAFLIDRQGRIYRKLAGDTQMRSLDADVRKLLREP